MCAITEGLNTKPIKKDTVFNVSLSPLSLFSFSQRFFFFKLLPCDSTLLKKNTVIISRITPAATKRIAATPRT